MVKGLVKPVWGFPALLILNRRKTLVVADLHLGIEEEYRRKGALIPSQTGKILKELLNLVEMCRSKQLVLLGDVKHLIPTPPTRVKKEITDFLRELAEKTRVVVVPGNHDGGITELCPGEVYVASSRGLLIENVGLFHGHAWPSLEVLKARVLVMGHNHPVIAFTDEFGYRTYEKAWIIAKVNVGDLFKKHPLGKDVKLWKEKKQKTLIIMPAFNPLIGGTAFNSSDEALGPVLRSGCVNLDEAEVYLVDGTFLGKLSMLKALSHLDNP